MDVLLKGDVLGFVCIFNECLLVIFDWFGNNCIDNLCNIVEDGCVLVFFIVLGVGEMLCVNGMVIILVDLVLFVLFVV